MIAVIICGSLLRWWWRRLGTWVMASSAVPASVRHGTEWEARPALGPGVRRASLIIRAVLSTSRVEERVLLPLIFETGDPVPEGRCLIVVVD